MKLTKLQKHYHLHFKEFRKSVYKKYPTHPKNKIIINRIYNPKLGMKLYKNKPNSVLKQFLKYNNMQLIQAYSFDNHKQQTRTKPTRIEIAFNVNNIPYILSVTNGGYVSFNMNMKPINEDHFDTYTNHFGVSYYNNKDEYQMWTIGEENNEQYLKDYKDILLKELQEEEMFQYSILYKNIHIHKVLTKAAVEISKFKNFTALQIITELQKVIQCLEKSENL